MHKDAILKEQKSDEIMYKNYTGILLTILIIVIYFVKISFFFLVQEFDQFLPSQSSNMNQKPHIEIPSTKNASA